MGMAKKKPKEDAVQAAFRVVQEATGQAPKTDPSVKPVDPDKNPAAVALGRLGGAKGGKARAEKLSSAQRSEIAAKAAAARWQKMNGESNGAS